MTSNNIKQLDAQNVMQTYARFDAVIDRGHGATLYSPEGKEYIDFTSGIGVNCLGYGNEKWANAVYEQAMKLQHISNLYYSAPYVKLADTLTTRTGMKNVFFSNSGAEANEGIIKLARKYSYDKYGPGRNKILTLVQSFHGRTITTLAATGQDSFHKNFFPFTEGFSHVPAGDIAALQAALADGAGAMTAVSGSGALSPEQSSKTGICAVMIELIQGEGGVLPLDVEYVKVVEKLCRERDILLLLDEVQTGVGRTGTLFAFEQYGIAPDAVSFAKGIAGGLPMGGFMANEKCSTVLQAGDHATTFGGNPVSAAAAIEVLNQLSPEVLAEVAKKGEYIRKTVSDWNIPGIGTPRGLGLMIGVPVSGANPKELAQLCAQKGLLIVTAGTDALRMLPPLLITFDEIDKGLSILKSVLEESL